MTKDHFRKVLAMHLAAKMDTQGLSLQEVTTLLGSCSRNWVFRASSGLDGYEVGVPDTLIALLDWLELEPRDFAQPDQKSGPGHVSSAILRLTDYPMGERLQLLEVVKAYLKESPGFVRLHTREVAERSPY